MNPTNSICKTVIIALLFYAQQLNAANFYWVGGSGNWSDYNTHWATSSGGQIYWAHVPTPTDTVIFDSLSFTGFNDMVIADNNVYCHTMKWLGSDSMPVFTYSGLQPILRIYGSLLIDTTTQWAYQGKIIFCAIDTGNTITTNGTQLHYAQMRGDTAASWELLDTFRVSHLVFSSGNFYSRGQTIITGNYEQGIPNLTRQFLDTSDVYCYRLRNNSNPIYFDADSARFIITGDSLQGGGLHYYSVEFMGHAGMTGSNTIDHFKMHSNADIIDDDIFGTFESTRPGVLLSLGGNITITDTTIFNGACSGMSMIAGSGTINFQQAGTILQTVFIDGVSVTGNPTANNSVIQNASGWTSTNNPTPRSLFWVNGQGNWSDTVHWSLTSGGNGNECSPTPLDDVNFDANSFTQINEVSVADNHITLFEDMQWTGSANTPNLIQTTGYMMGFGDLLIQNPVLWNVDYLILRSSSPNAIIDIDNNFLRSVQIIGSASFQQLSPIHATAYMIGCANYVSNAHPINAGAVGAGSPSGNINFGGSEIYAPRWMMGTVAGTFTAPDSLTTSFLYDLSTNMYNIVYTPSVLRLSSNSTFHDFTVGASAEIDGNSTFDTLRFTGSDIQILLYATSTQTITGDLQINSSCATPVTIKSKTPGSPAYISKASGVINCDYLVLEDVHATGGATFNATNTCALQNVSGWNVTPPPTLPMYWIGGTGDWKDPQHWSYSSGGSPAGCIPHPLTDVYFDALSFPSAGESVNMNVSNGYCHNMDWTSATGSPSFAAPATLNRMNCFGSMILEQGVSTYGVNLHMRALTSGNIIDPKNADVGNIVFNGVGGSWSIIDTLGCDTLDLMNGTVYTNGNAISARLVTSLNIVNRELHLDSSTVTTGGWQMNNDSALILDATNATIETNMTVFQGGNRYYKEVILDNEATLVDADTFRTLRIRGSVSISGEQHMDSLFLEAGGEMIRLGSDTLFVDSAIIANSNSSSYIGIQAASPIDFAYISKAGDTVCIDYMILQGINASGGATFFAGSNSSDVDNNSGWTWQSCGGQIVVWPGDANYDLVADNLDILSIGIAFGEAGGIRPNASLTWMAQPHFEWNREFADSTDIVHADCDGNGLIGWSDTTAVSLNYGLNHPARYAAPEETASVGTEIKVVVTQAAYQPGDTVELPVWLGTQNSPVNSAYGVAFTLNWDYPFIEPGTLEFDYSNSWFLTGGNNVHLEKPFYSSQYCDLGMSRISHTDTSGTGELVLMRFVLTQNANGPLKFWFTDLHMIDFAEDTLPMFSTGGTINAAVGISEYSTTEMSAYPNPATSNISISTTMSGPGTITLYDVTGRIAKQEYVENISTALISVAEVESGYYFLVAASEEGSAQIRIQKL